MKIAVVGIQGDVIEHINSLKQIFSELNIKGDVAWARTKDDLKNVDGITIPGGESTTIGTLLSVSEVDKEIKNLAIEGKPILGTCAGAILLTKFGLINMKIERNAYGRQKDSFESVISTSIGETRGVFIRAPLIKEVSKDVEIFAKNNNEIVGAKKGNILALTFHPELSEDTKIFRYFVENMVLKKSSFRKRSKISQQLL